MQEEVTQKTIALYVKVGKGAARLTEQALQKAIKKFLEQKSKAPHGKQTMRQLMKQNAGVSNIEITDSNIKAFESTAKKYNIDFSLKNPSLQRRPQVAERICRASPIKAGVTSGASRTVR